jgi:hypothetical protein
MHPDSLTWHIYYLYAAAGMLNATIHLLEAYDLSAAAFISGSDREEKSF